MKRDTLENLSFATPHRIGVVGYRQIFTDYTIDPIPPPGIPNLLLASDIRDMTDLVQQWT